MRKEWTLAVILAAFLLSAAATLAVVSAISWLVTGGALLWWMP